MVNISLIRQSNGQIDELSAPNVAVFVGGTSGIGKITLAELAGLETKLKVYVIGRKETEASFKPFLQKLRQANSKADIIWVEGRVSLLSDVKRICDKIKTLESKIDLLFLTTGYPPFSGRSNTSEGLDVSHSLNYYSRICFILNLLPLLRASEKARVISVLAGGMENAGGFNVNDMNLEHPGAFGAIPTQRHMATMGTLTLERLAEVEENQQVIFIHSYPGAVNTGNLLRGWKAGSLGPMLVAIVFNPIIWAMGYSLKESAERHLYMTTSGSFGGKGPLLLGVVGKTTKGKDAGGLFLVNQKCDTVLNEKHLAKLRETAQEAVWAKTLEIIRPYI